MARAATAGAARVDERLNCSMSTASIKAIFVATTAGESMMRVSEIEAMAGVGLRGDRYATGEGYYAPSDVCEVTLIEGEVLDVIRTAHGIQVHNGEHRRNIVTRGLSLRDLPGKRLRIDEVLFEYERPRPPCGYVERLTEKGMTRALGEGAGICARVVTGGLLREGAEIQILDAPNVKPPRRLP